MVIYFYCFMVIDFCGNSVLMDVQFIIEDMIDLMIIMEVEDLIIICQDGDVLVLELFEWFVVNGNVIVIDDCGELSWDNDLDLIVVVDLCVIGGIIFVIFIVIDECGNDSIIEVDLIIIQVLLFGVVK